MTEYDPGAIRRFADRLYAKASFAVLGSAALGVIIGLVGAPFIIESLPIALATRCPEWVPPAVLGVLGWGQGLERGWQLRLQAQAALCQLRIEENTRGTGSPKTGDGSA